jgi:hypothetical protein
MITAANYGPMIYRLLMRASQLRGQVGGGWALEIEILLGPVKWHRALKRVPFGAKKSQIKKLKSQNLLEIRIAPVHKLTMSFFPNRLLIWVWFRRVRYQKEERYLEI